jgi:APA family basic amino acid/polyamine antiporter
VALKRALGLPLLILYGLGVTVGAGIYVLVGAAAAKAGLYAPVSFLLAAIVVAFTGFSYAELGARFPVSAGAAAYVRHGLNSNGVALAVGGMVLATGVVSAAAISIGAVGYLRHFVDLPPPVLVAAVVLVMGFAAAWGIVESVTVAAICTAIEVLGLVLVIGFAVAHRPELLGEIDRIFPPSTADAWTGIAAAGLLAFFAFIGFEGIANVAEEAVDPGRTMPRAILATLAIATLLYVAVVGAVVLAVPIETLSGSSAPLALVFEDADPAVGTVFIAVAVFATVNGVLVQMIMSSRVLYGLAAQGSLPSWLGANQLSRVAATTRTPLVATGAVVTAVLVLALVFPIAGLAEATAVIVLVVFVLVNLALLQLKRRPETMQPPAFRVPVWVPAVGAFSSAALLCADFFLN